MAKRYASRVRVNGQQVRRSHYVWNENHPEDPVLPGEVIHHKDGDKKNDAPENLEKMTDAAHRSHHSHAGVAALAKWRKENPEKASAMSKANAKKMHEKIKRKGNL